VMVNVGLKLVCFLVVINTTSSGMVDAGVLPLSCCYCTDKLLLSLVKDVSFGTLPRAWPCWLRAFEEVLFFIIGPVNF
jgi:hypothetical protein